MTMRSPVRFLLSTTLAGATLLAAGNASAVMSCDDITKP